MNEMCALFVSSYEKMSSLLNELMHGVGGVVRYVGEVPERVVSDLPNGCESKSGMLGLIYMRLMLNSRKADRVLSGQVDKVLWKKMYLSFMRKSNVVGVHDRHAYQVLYNLTRMHGVCRVEGNTITWISHALWHANVLLNVGLLEMDLFIANKKLANAEHEIACLHDVIGCEDSSEAACVSLDGSVSIIYSLDHYDEDDDTQFSDSLRYLARVNLDELDVSSFDVSDFDLSVEPGNRTRMDISELATDGPMEVSVESVNRAHMDISESATDGPMEVSMEVSV